MCTSKSRRWMESMYAHCHSATVAAAVACHRGPIALQGFDTQVRLRECSVYRLCCTVNRLRASALPDRPNWLDLWTGTRGTTEIHPLVSASKPGRWNRLCRHSEDAKTDKPLNRCSRCLLVPCGRERLAFVARAGSAAAQPLATSAEQQTRRSTLVTPLAHTERSNNNACTYSFEEE